VVTDRIQELPEGGVEAVNVKYKEEGSTNNYQKQIKSGNLKKEDSPRRGTGQEGKSMKSTKRED
jgi:hypothetical protein